MLAEAIDTDLPGNVAAALDAGADVQAAGKEGLTPLLYAMATRKKMAADELLKRGADPNRRADNKENAVTVAALLAPKDLGYLKLVLAHGGDPNTRMDNNDPVLVLLIAQANNEGIKVLAAAKADLNIKDRGNTDAIVLAAMIEHWDCVYTLLEAGARWDGQERTGGTVANQAYGSEIGKDSPLYPSLEKTTAFLKSKGVHFPPPSPTEVRKQRQGPL